MTRRNSELTPRSLFVLVGVSLIASTACDAHSPLSGDDPQAAEKPTGTDAHPAASDDDAGPSTQGSGDTGGAPNAATGLPCDVAQVVREHCQLCHGATPQFGAPMALSTFADFRKPAISDPSKQVYQIVAERVSNNTRPMPPVSQPPMTAVQQSSLTRWLAQGAPGPNTQACSENGGGRSSPSEAPDPADCDTRVELRAHGDTPGSKYAVPLANDTYQCFYFRAPWQNDVQAVAIRASIDDARVVHHWILYAEDNASYQDGSAVGCNGNHPNSYMISGWAPGGIDKILPPEAGLRMPKGPNGFFILEVHYNNLARYPDANDQSGVKICATSKPRQYTAGVHWLGTELILLPPGVREQSVSGTCRPDIKTPVHVLASTPHMHKLGTHMTTTIQRTGGRSEVLVDRPFVFGDQTTYETPAILNPGDTLKTTCTYHNDTGSVVIFGEKTSNEMCFNFVIAYPDGVLSTGGYLLNGPDRCLR